MAERMLIARLKRTSPTQGELYQAKHKYADLKCFDLGMLADAGVDVETLQIGVEIPVRFWAVWEYSERLNKAGNPYKDLLIVEPMHAPATVTSTAIGDPEVLGELRAIRALLQAMADAQGLQMVTAAAEEHEEPEPEPDTVRVQTCPETDICPPILEAPEASGEPGGNGGDPGELDAAFPRFGDGSPVPETAIGYYTAFWQDRARTPADVDELRTWANAQKGAAKKG